MSPTSAHPLLALIASCGLALPAPAQTLFQTLPIKEHYPPLPAGAFGVADVDGDLDLDVVADDRLFLNDGSGDLTDVSATHMPPSQGAANQVLVADVDGDGDLDLVLGQGLDPFGLPAYAPRLLINDGTGRFADRSATQLPPGIGSSSVLALGDVDRDGDLDLALAVVSTGVGRNPYYPVQNRLYLNDGQGRFTDGTAGRLPVVADASLSVVCADVDGDGDLDLVFGNLTDQSLTVTSRVHLNDGTGVFTDATASRLPSGFDWLPWLAVDIDRDGDVDLLTGGPAGLLRNDGTGNFTADPSLPSSGYGGAVLTDFDRDHDDDLVIGDTGFFNDGAGNFTALPPVLRIGHAGGVVVAIDQDGDGDDDLLYGNGVRHLMGSDGWFHPTFIARLAAGSSRGQGIAVGDVDGNGRPDIVAGTTIWMQMGSEFVDETAARIPPPASHPNSAWANALGDLDGDGALDLVVVNSFFPHAQDCVLYQNDGRGFFIDVTSAQLPTWTHGQCTDVAIADLDADGDLDLVFASDTGGAVFRNDGHGYFADVTASALPANPGTGLMVALGDVDGDGDTDIVFADGHYTWYSNVPENQNRLFLNSGNGIFQDATATHFPVDLTVSYCVAMADLDGDGDLDLVFGGGQEWTGSQFVNVPDVLWRNDGTGTFVDVTGSSLQRNVEEASSIAAADIDDDGDVDLMIARVGSNGPELLLNDGHGRFQAAPGALFQETQPFIRSISLDDVDGDGDPDLTLSSSYSFPGFGCGGSCPSGTGFHLFTNLARQIQAPRLPILGQSYALRLMARGPHPGGFDVAVPVVSPRTASIAMPPLGILGLDPNTLVALPFVSIPQPAGEATVTLTVPPTPSLAGGVFHAQALMLRIPFSEHFTDVVSEVIVQ